MRSYAKFFLSRKRPQSPIRDLHQLFYNGIGGRLIWGRHYYLALAKMQAVNRNRIRPSSDST
jgi:hypothetical protein